MITESIYPSFWGEHREATPTPRQKMHIYEVFSGVCTGHSTTSMSLSSAWSTCCATYSTLTKTRVGGSQELFSAWRLIQSLLGSCVSVWSYMSGIGNVIWLCISTHCLSSRGITERVFSPVRYLTQPAWYSPPRCWVLSRIHLGWFVVGYSLY